MKARQVVFTGPMRAEVEDREVPAPAAGEVLVRTATTLISTGTELTILRGGHAPGSNWEAVGRFPWLAGYCNVGVVEQVGPGARRLRPGDRVASEGPHASIYAMAEDALRPVPDGLPDEEAVFATIAEIVMHGVRRAGITLGESAVVCGLGLLGQLTVTFARFVGAWPVIGVDIEPSRCEAALAGGASAVAHPDGAADVISRATDGLMADVVFEVTGNPAAIPRQIAWLRTLGRQVILSSPRGPTTMDFHDLVNARGTVIIGAHNFTHASVPNEHNRWTRHSDACLYLALAAAGLVTHSRLITDRFAAERAPEAYARLAECPDRSLAVALDWNA